MSYSYRVGVLSYQIIGGVGAVVCLGGGVGAYLARQYPVVAMCAIFVVVGLYVLLLAGSYELDEAAVHHKTIIGHFRMRWSEIEKVEVGTVGSLVLHGRGKRFALPPADYWSGKQKPEAFELLRRKLTAVPVPIYSSSTGDYKCHKNVRVGAGEA